MTMPDVDTLGAELLEILGQDHPACRLFSARWRRRQFFDESLFGEPAWDMLLLLCCADAGGLAIGANVLTGCTGVPVSVAERWLAVLEERGLVVRRHNPDNLFFKTIHLTDAGSTRMEDYLKEISLKP